MTSALEAGGGVRLPKERNSLRVQGQGPSLSFLLKMLIDTHNNDGRADFMNSASWGTWQMWYFSVNLSLNFWKLYMQR